MSREAVSGTLLPILHQVMRVAKQNASTLAGMSCLWVWIWAIFQSSILKAPRTFLMDNQLFSESWGIVLWVTPLLSYAMGFAILGALFYFKQIVPRGRIYRATIPIFMLAGFALTLLSFSFNATAVLGSKILCLVGSVFLGLGTSFVHVEYGRISGYIGLRRTMILVALATLPASAILACLSSTPVTVTALAIAACGLTSALLAYRIVSFGQVDLPRPQKRQLKISTKLMATAFIQGCSLGAIEILLDGSTKEVSLTLTVIGFVLGALLVLFVTIRFKPDFDRLLYCLGFPTMAAGCILITIFAPSVAGGAVVHAIGYRFVDILIWALMAYVMNSDDQPANWVTSVATLWLIAGQFCGVFACWLFNIELGLIRGIEVGGAFIAFALMLCAVLAASSKNMETGWGMVRPADDSETLGCFDACCQALAKEYRLTARESEVFAFLAKGYPRQYICEKLVLADGTVKSHIRRIYQKMDIHSRNDAITLVEHLMGNYSGGHVESSK